MRGVRAPQGTQPMEVGGRGVAGEQTSDYGVAPLITPVGRNAGWPSELRDDFHGLADFAPES
jgi:hypothetical protein